jgi:hypothetical protein
MTRTPPASRRERRLARLLPQITALATSISEDIDYAMYLLAVIRGDAPMHTADDAPYTAVEPLVIGQETQTEADHKPTAH